MAPLEGNRIYQLPSCCQPHNFHFRALGYQHTDKISRKNCFFVEFDNYRLVCETQSFKQNKHRHWRVNFVRVSVQTNFHRWYR